MFPHGELVLPPFFTLDSERWWGAGVSTLADHYSLINGAIVVLCLTAQGGTGEKSVYVRYLYIVEAQKRLWLILDSKPEMSHLTFLFIYNVHLFKYI
jgi:hypothetical protein